MITQDYPLVSIVIVNWNGKKWLKKCLDSLLSQTYKNFEVIFVDNASEDSSVEYVQKNYSEVKIIRSDKNLGFAGGNNLGIDNSKGNLLLLINTDTWIEPEFLQKLMDFYKKNNFDVVAPLEANYLTGDKRKPYISLIDPFGHPAYRPAEGKYKNKPPFFLTGVCLLFSKELYRETDGLDNNFFMYCEEVDWFWRLNLMKKKFTYINDLYIYHAGGGSMKKGINKNTFLWRNQNTLQMLLKNWNNSNLLWVLPVYFLQNIVEIFFFIVIFKPKISYTYLQSWWFNLKNIHNIIDERRWIQKNRIIGDWVITKKMYFGFGKLLHLLEFIKQ